MRESSKAWLFIVMYRVRIVPPLQDVDLFEEEYLNDFNGSIDSFEGNLRIESRVKRKSNDSSLSLQRRPTGWAGFFFGFLYGDYADHDDEALLSNSLIACLPKAHIACDFSLYQCVQFPRDSEKK
jgi:hypothetical protein